MTDALASLTTATAGANTSKATKSAATFSGDFQTFLTLLTTQLKNQDPTSPVDTNEFTQQLVMFSQVEQQILGNQNLESLIKLTQDTQELSAASYIGKLIEAESKEISLINGNVDFAIEIDGTPKQVALNVVNSSGRIVYTELVNDYQGGRTNLSWDGKDNSGVQMPDGAYKLSIAAADETGTQIPARTYTLGVVDGVDLSGEEIILRVGTASIPLSKVQGVTDLKQIQNIPNS
jgi:flagellar basal-body rod modification protein FlgD